MIKRSVIIALVLIGIYAILFNMVLKVRYDQITQSQWQSNLVSAQNYLYGTVQSQKVIIGSSLAARLVADSLDATYLNLSIGGMSIFDGLELVKAKETKPKIMFIESNYFMNPGNDEFHKTIFDPVGFRVKKYIPMFRDNIKPVALIGMIIHETFRWMKHGANTVEAEVKHEQKTIINNDLRIQLIKNQVVKERKMPDAQSITSCLTTLSGYIFDLRRQGVKIVFFEMPVDTSIMALASCKSLKRSLRNKFSTPDIDFIEAPAGRYFPTTDGIHLTREGALAYTLYFREKVKEAGCGVY